MKKVFSFLIIILLFIPFVINAKELELYSHENFGGSEADSYADILETSDGGYIIVGVFLSPQFEGLTNKGSTDVFIVKYSSIGDIVWKTSWGGNGSDSLNSALLSKDDELILSLKSSSSDLVDLPNKGGDDCVIVKYDINGNLLWEKSWGGNGSDSFKSSLITSDGSIVASGYSMSTDLEAFPALGSHDAFILKYDSNGNLLWQRRFGGNSSDIFNNMILTTDDDIIAICDSYSTDLEDIAIEGSNDLIILKYNSDGEVQWKKRFGGNKTEGIHSISKFPNDDFILVGGFNSSSIDELINNGSYDGFIVKFNKNGEMLWENSFGGSAWDYFDHVLALPDGSTIATAQFQSTDIESLSNKGYRDAAILKYDINGNVIWEKSFGGEGVDSFTKIFLTNNNEILATIQPISENINELFNDCKNDVIILRINTDGVILWKSLWGGDNLDLFNDVLFTKANNMIFVGGSSSTNIENLNNNGNLDAIIVKYLFNYDLNILSSMNGTSSVIRKNDFGIITPTPNGGYIVDKIIVKDSLGNEVEITENDDGTYSFLLYDNVTIETIYSSQVDNPKTGVVSTIVFVPVIIFMLMCFYFIKRCEKSYEI